MGNQNIDVAGNQNVDVAGNQNAEVAMELEESVSMTRPDEPFIQNFMQAMNAGLTDLVETVMQLPPAGMTNGKPKKKQKRTFSNYLGDEPDDEEVAYDDEEL